MVFNYIHRVVQLSPLSTSRIFTSPPKQSLYLPISPLTIPWQILIYFLSLCICLFWTFYINRIIQYVAFCDWLLSLHIMFSGFIHITTCINTLFFFITEQYSIVWIYHSLSIHYLMDIWVVFTFWLLWIMLLWTSAYTFLCKPMFSLSLGIYLGLELLGYMITMFKLYWNWQFSKCFHFSNMIIKTTCLRICDN